MSRADDLLKKYRPDLTYEQLTLDERNTLHGWLEQLSAKALTVEDVKKHIRVMIGSVEQELSNEPEYIQVLFFRFRNDKNILLKARLRNYLLLEAFLTAPERAKEALENQLKALEGRGGKK